MLSDSDKVRHTRRLGKRNPNGWYTDKQKLEAVQLWLVCGSMTQTAAALNMPAATIEKWRYTDWWKELVDQIKAEGRVKLSGRLQRIVGRSLDQIEERLENGDWILDSKTGQLVRKPLLARDLVRISTDFIDRTQKLESVTREEQTQQAVEDRLKLLADSFASFAKRVRRVEVEDIDAIQIQGPASVDVLPETEDGEEVGSGDPEGEEAARQGAEEEEIDGLGRADGDGGACNIPEAQAPGGPEQVRPDPGN